MGCGASTALLKKRDDELQQYRERRRRRVQQAQQSTCPAVSKLCDEYRGKEKADEAHFTDQLLAKKSEPLTSGKSDTVQDWFVISTIAIKLKKTQVLVMYPPREQSIVDVCRTSLELLMEQESNMGRSNMSLSSSATTDENKSSPTIPLAPQDDLTAQDIVTHEERLADAWLNMAQALQLANKESVLLFEDEHGAVPNWVKEESEKNRWQCRMERCVTRRDCLGAALGVNPYHVDALHQAALLKERSEPNAGMHFHTNALMMDRAQPALWASLAQLLQPGESVSVGVDKVNRCYAMTMCLLCNQGARNMPITGATAAEWYDLALAFYSEGIAQQQPQSASPSSLPLQNLPLLSTSGGADVDTKRLLVKVGTTTVSFGSCVLNALVEYSRQAPNGGQLTDPQLDELWDHAATFIEDACEQQLHRHKSKQRGGGPVPAVSNEPDDESGAWGGRPKKQPVAKASSGAGTNDVTSLLGSNDFIEDRDGWLLAYSHPDSSSQRKLVPKDLEELFLLKAIERRADRVSLWKLAAALLLRKDCEDSSAAACEDGNHSSTTRRHSTRAHSISIFGTSLGAKEALVTVHTMDPDDDGAWFRLGEVLRREGVEEYSTDALGVLTPEFCFARSCNTSNEKDVVANLTAVVKAKNKWARVIRPQKKQPGVGGNDPSESDGSTPPSVPVTQPVAVARRATAHFQEAVGAGPSTASMHLSEQQEQQAGGSAQPGSGITEAELVLQSMQLRRGGGTKKERFDDWMKVTELLLIQPDDDTTPLRYQEGRSGTAGSADDAAQRVSLGSALMMAYHSASSEPQKQHVVMQCRESLRLIDRRRSAKEAGSTNTIPVAATMDELNGDEATLLEVLVQYALTHGTWFCWRDIGFRLHCRHQRGLREGGSGGQGSSNNNGSSLAALDPLDCLLRSLFAKKQQNPFTWALLCELLVARAEAQRVRKDSVTIEVMGRDEDAHSCGRRALFGWEEIAELAQQQAAAENAGDDEDAVAMALMKSPGTTGVGQKRLLLQDDLQQAMLLSYESLDDRQPDLRALCWICAVEKIGSTDPRTFLNLPSRMLQRQEAAVELIDLCVRTASNMQHGVQPAPGANRSLLLSPPSHKLISFAKRVRAWQLMAQTLGAYEVRRVPWATSGISRVACAQELLSLDPTIPDQWSFAALCLTESRGLADTIRIERREYSAHQCCQMGLHLAEKSLAARTARDQPTTRGDSSVSFSQQQLKGTSALQLLPPNLLAHSAIVVDELQTSLRFKGRNIEADDMLIEGLLATAGKGSPLLWLAAAHLLTRRREQLLAGAVIVDRGTGLPLSSHEDRANKLVANLPTRSHVTVGHVVAHACRENATNGQAWVLLGLLLQREAVVVKVGSSAIATAMAALTRALTIDPTLPLAWALIASEVPPGGSITIPVSTRSQAGRTTTQLTADIFDCCRMALARDPSLTFVWRTVALAMCANCMSSRTNENATFHFDPSTAALDADGDGYGDGAAAESNTAAALLLGGLRGGRKPAGTAQETVAELQRHEQQLDTYYTRRECLVKALTLFPTDETLWKALAMALITSSGTDEEQRGKPGKHPAPHHPANSVLITFQVDEAILYSNNSAQLRDGDKRKSLAAADRLSRASLVQRMATGTATVGSTQGGLPSPDKGTNIDHTANQKRITALGATIRALEHGNGHRDPSNWVLLAELMTAYHDRDQQGRPSKEDDVRILDGQRHVFIRGVSYAVVNCFHQALSVAMSPTHATTSDDHHQLPFDPTTMIEIGGSVTIAWYGLWQRLLPHQRINVSEGMGCVDRHQCLLYAAESDILTYSGGEGNKALYFHATEPSTSTTSSQPPKEGTTNSQSSGAGEEEHQSSFVIPVSEAPHVWFELAKEVDDFVTLPLSGREFSQYEILELVCKSDPTNPKAWVALGSQGGSKALHTTAEECCLNALSLVERRQQTLRGDQAYLRFSAPYTLLSQILQRCVEETPEEDLLADQSSEVDFDVYPGAAKTNQSTVSERGKMYLQSRTLRHERMSTDELRHRKAQHVSIHIPGKGVFTRKDLLVKALSINQDDLGAWMQLAEVLVRGETVSIPTSNNGREIRVDDAKASAVADQVLQEKIASATRERQRVHNGLRALKIDPMTLTSAPTNRPEGGETAFGAVLDASIPPSNLSMSLTWLGTTMDFAEGTYQSVGWGSLKDHPRTGIPPKERGLSYNEVIVQRHQERVKAYQAALREIAELEKLEKVLQAAADKEAAIEAAQKEHDDFMKRFEDGDDDEAAKNDPWKTMLRKTYDHQLMLELVSKTPDKSKKGKKGLWYEEGGALM